MLVDKFSFVVRCIISVFLLSLLMLILMLAATITLNQCRRLYAERIAAPMSRALLATWGIQVKVHGPLQSQSGQVMYISNHSSTIDLFVLLGLALPNTRFFLSAYLRKYLPIRIIGTLIGNIWIVTQKRPEERVEIFKQAEALLRKTQDSVYLSPEGKRVTTGKIGAFNKGAFHLATALQIPIIPLLLHIPKSINPGIGLHARPGRVDVHVGEPIDTTSWSLTALIENKDCVRDIYVQWHTRIYDD